MSDKIIIKKYQNRRLYNTKISSYVTLDDLYNMIKNDEDFAVIDVKTGENLTGLTLTQVILDRQNQANSLIPDNILRQFIKYHDDKYNNNIFVNYSQMMLKQFENFEKEAKNKGFYNKPMEQLMKMWDLEEITKQNLQFFQKSMELFSSSFNKKD